MKSIFISSTFRDMQAERDILHLQVFPELRKRLAQYGEDVQELDLRWGVDTSRLSEEESGEFVVETCIDSIDRCKPYMVVLLGNRYGWIPDQKVIDTVADDRVRHWYESGGSITQLEIQYGALRADITPDRCVFCFRNEAFPQQVPEAQRGIYQAESALHASKLQALKEKIRSRADAPILNYDACWDDAIQSPGGLEDFARELTEMLWKILSADLTKTSEKEEPEAQIFRQARMTARQYLNTYVSRKLERDVGPMALTGRSAFWFSGEPGSGKSAMMAKIADNGARVGSKVFLYYGGNAGCSSANTLARTLIWWFNSLDDQDPQPLGKYVDESILSLQRHTNKQRDYDFSILIDGLDQMEPEALSLVCWLSRQLCPQDQPAGASFWHGLAVSSTEAFAQARQQEIEDCFNIRKMEPLTNIEIGTIAQSHSAHRGKKLDAKVLNKICSKPQTHNPYYLSLLLQKLFMMDGRDFQKAEELAPGMEGLSLFMCQEIDAAPEDLEDMAIAMLLEASDKVSRRTSVSQQDNTVVEPLKVLMMMAVAREGLSIPEINQILKMTNVSFPTLLLERMFSYLYDSFQVSEKGVWDFKHRLLRESLCNRMRKTVYRGFALLIMALRYEQNARGSELLYYAWQTADPERGVGLLDHPWRSKSINIEILLQMIRAEDGADYLASVLEKVKSETCAMILAELERGADHLLRLPAAARVLSALAPKADSVPNHRFYYFKLRAQQLLWRYDTGEFAENWKSVVESAELAGPTNNFVGSSMFFLCRELLGDSRFAQLWPDAVRWLETYNPENYLRRMYDATVQWAKLLMAYHSAESDGLKLQALKSAKAFFLQDDLTLSIGVVAYSWRALTAELLLEQEEFQDVVDLTSSAIGYLRQKFDLRSQLQMGTYLIRNENCLAGAIKASSAIKYYQNALDDCARIWETYPCTNLQYLACMAGIGLWRAHWSNQEQDKAYRVLEDLIPALDQFVETIGPEKLPVDVMQKILDQRYGRVYRRRTQRYIKTPIKQKAQQDAMVRLLRSSNYRDPDLHYSILPWKYVQQQEADFTYMDAHYPDVESRCKTYSVYLDMVYAKLEQMRFYEACQMEKPMISACSRLMKMAEFLVNTKRNRNIWMALVVRMEVSQVLFRNYYGKAAAELAAEVFGMMQTIDRQWLQQTKRTAEFERRIVSCYLLMAKAKMREEDEETLKNAFAFTYQAVTKLSGQEGEEPMPASCDDLRCDSWLAMCKVLRKMKRDYGEIATRADKYWQEADISRVLAKGSFSDLLRLLEYGQILSLTGRNSNDPQRLQKAARILCGLVAYAPEEDPSRWEDLYTELMALGRYCWNHGEVFTEPQELMGHMIRAFRSKAQWGELKKEEQILFTYYVIHWRDPAVLAGKKLPDEELQEAALAQSLLLDSKTGRATLRARLVLCKLLKGENEAAAELASHMEDVDIREVSTMALMTMVCAALQNHSQRASACAAEAEEWLARQGDKGLMIGRYVQIICRVVESRTDDAAGVEAALQGLDLLNPLLESLDQKAVQQTLLPDWTVQLCDRVVRQWNQTPGCIEAEAYQKALSAGSSGVRLIYLRQQDDEEKDKALDRIIRLTRELARLYRYMGQTAKAIRMGAGLFLQEDQRQQQPDLAFAKELWQFYQELCRWRAECDEKAETTLEIAVSGAKLLRTLFRLEQDAQWITELLKHTEDCRGRLAKADKDPYWRTEKIAGTYDLDRAGCLDVLQTQPLPQWQQQYLQTAEAQVQLVGDGGQSTLEEILLELRGMEPLNEELSVRRLDLMEQVVQILDGIPSDLLYIMMRAVREVEDISQATAFVEKLRKTMPERGL